MNKLNLMTAGVVAAVSLFSLPLLAQPQHGGPEQMIERLSEDLELSEYQEIELEEIFKVAESNCDEYERGPEHFECMEEQHEAIDTEILSMLDDEQLELFEELKEERRNQQASRGQGERGERRERGGRGFGRP